MSESSLSPRSRHKSAAVGLLGAAMVLTPLAQLMRYQGEELHAVQAQRALLDPLAQVLAVQRGLQAHRALARRVLVGELAHERARRDRQADIDAGLQQLELELGAGAWLDALDEAQVLRNDWSELAGRVMRREIKPGASDASHRLRIEQALQVVDLLALSGLQLGAGDAALPALAALARAEAMPPAAPDEAFAGPSDEALQAGQAAADAALRQAADSLDARAGRLRTQRWLAAAAAAAWALLTARFTLRAWRTGRPGQPAATGACEPARHPQPADGSSAEAQRLMQRLRRSPATRPAAEAGPDPQATLPSQD